MMTIIKATSSKNGEGDPAGDGTTQPTNCTSSVARLSMSEVVAEKPNLRLARKHERKLYQKIKRAHRARKRKRVEHFTRFYLMSFHARYVATVKANRKLKPHRKVPARRLPEIAANLDPWRGSTEKVVVNFKPKKDNEHDFRPIMDFGIENRTLQYLVQAALEAQANIHPHQFAIRGGRSAAGRAVMAALAAGYHWGAEVDIADCYPSFNGDNISDLLPIPKGVTRNVLLSCHLNITLGNVLRWYFGPEDASDEFVGDHGLFAEEFSEARRGIPQGSAASALVTELLLATTIANLPGNGRVVVYADNFLVMAREEGDAVSMTLALRDALRGHPAGPLWPKLVNCFEPAETEFEFLGYVFRRKAGSIDVAPSTKNLAKFEYKFSKSIDRARKSEDSNGKKHRQLRHLRKYVRSWTAAFSLWPEAGTFRNEKMALIDDVVAGLDGPQAA